MNKSPIEVIREWQQAYNNHDSHAVVLLYAESVTNIQLPWSTPIQGREAMRQTYVNIFKAFPDIHMEVENAIVSGDCVAVEWHFSGTMKGPFAGYEPNGGYFDMRGCEVLTILNDKIISQHGYWDKATMFNQLGL